MSRIGVLALQGGFAAHARALEELGHTTVEIRAPEMLDETLGGLVLPGGESTTHLKLIAALEMAEPLRAFVASGRPVFATCAGLILAAAQVRDPEQESFGWIDATVSRNAWGRQVHSFEARADNPLPGECGNPLPLLFIRAPRILETGPEVEVLATFRGEPVLIRQDNFTAATFHPELTADRRVHRRVFGG